MSSAPWSNETERADYYMIMFNNQLVISDRLQAEIDKMKNSIYLNVVIPDEKKEEIKNDCLKKINCEIQYNIAQIKSEARKECVERIKEELRNIAKIDFQDGYYYLVGTAFFDNLLKEMERENNAKM